MAWEFELNDARIDEYKVNRAMVDDILDEVIVEVDDNDKNKCYIIPKKVAFLKPNPKDWYECENKLQSIVDAASVLIWLNNYIGE